MYVKAGKSKLQSAQVLSSNSARRRTLGSDSTRDYTGVERSFPLYAPGDIQSCHCSVDRYIDTFTVFSHMHVTVPVMESSTMEIQTAM